MTSIYALYHVHWITEEARTEDVCLGHYSTEEKADKAKALFLLANLELREHDLYVYRYFLDLDPIGRKPI